MGSGNDDAVRASGQQHLRPRESHDVVVPTVDATTGPPPERGDEILGTVIGAGDATPRPDVLG